ncbi:MAG: FAD-dependent oxidoreductase [Colwellia sp.]|nr:FAD-dependent oxidoreductase [Colwellia sp.]MCW8863725.1 FAD-dependent oxidoreductase [Colwellia sp.]MCW9081364.1 FAD-dependent oxidoreductase [Colwellia sp.]
MSNNDNMPKLSKANESSVKPVVILGTGLAGYGLAKEFRRIDKETPLLLITSDDGVNYNKPMLSCGYTKQLSSADLAAMSAGTMAKLLNASVWTFTQVTAIDTDAQELKIGNAITVGYSKLVLALGADAIKPPMNGDGLDKLHTVNDLLDYEKFRDAMRKSKAKKVAVIGAGLIGSEFTNDLLNGGFEVEAVDPLAYSLPTLLPEIAGKVVQRALEKQGAKFHFGTYATAVNNTPTGVEVSLSNGDVIEADMVVCGVGVRPRTFLAKSAGIEVNHGIVADRFLETSAKNIYTLGDCAEVEGNVLYYVAPLMAASRCLARTLTGSPSKVVYPAMPVTIKTPSCPVVVSPAARGAKGEWIIECDGNDVIAEFRSPTNELLGFALTGEAVKERMRLQKELPPILQ